MRIAQTMAALAVTALTLTACQTDDGADNDAADQAAGSQNNSSQEHDHAHDEHGDLGGEGKEVSSLKPRVSLAYDGGLLTVDAISGETVSDEKHDGLLRLNQVGDGRHLAIADGTAFDIFDSGNQAIRHEDHYHYYEADPSFTDVSYEAKKAGHVVAHDDQTALFADGTGDVTIVKTADIAKPDAEKRTVSTGDPHHGVAVPLEDGSVLHTVGTEEKRTTVRHVSEDGETLAETTDCPDVHGEATTEDGAVVFGCSNGPVIFRDGDFHKVSAEGYHRSGTLLGSEDSDIILGDLKVEKDAENEEPTSVVLINTKDDSERTVDLGETYRNTTLARGPEGEALVLTTAGELLTIDPDSGEITQHVKVIDPWKIPEDWQAPGAIVEVEGTDAYISDPESKKLVVVDLRNGEISFTHDLDVEATDMEVSTGR